ncbi:Lipoprotein [Gammaproteobacteria bacterium]
MSRQSYSLLTLTYLSVGAVGACRFVGYDGAQVSVAGALVLGVSASSAGTGDAYPVDILGTTLVETGDAIGIGDEIQSDASGRAIPLATGGKRTGRALSAATGDGQFIEILLIQS